MRTPTLAAMLALVFAVLFTGPFAAPAEAQDKSFSLPRAQVVADVQPDGSVLVTEQITYDFIGSFEGGYREIPLKDGMSVTDVSVSEVGRAYAPGASAELGSSGAPGTYGTADLGYAYRIVWHYRASYEERTFTVRYRLNGLAVAHDDVVDVYWQVWGDEWQEPLGSLEATMALPGDASKGEVKVFGHPASVSGKTSLGPDGIPPDGIPPDGISPDRVSPTLVASDVPAGQFVEMRVVFPRELLSSTGGARVEPGDGLQEIMDEEAAEARSEARRAWLMRLQPLFGLLLVVVSVGAMAFVYLRYGREPKVDYAERYEREPPTNDPPAVIGAIISQKPSVGSREFTATLFDLIRRGVLKAQPVSVKEGGFWGDKTMTDLRVDVGSSDPGSIEDFARNVLTLENFERRVLNVAERVLSHGALNLTDFQESIKDGDDRQANRSSYESFRNAVKREVERRDLVERSPGMWLGWAAILLGLAGAAWFVLSLLGVDAGVLISLIFSNLLAFAIVVVVFWVVFRRGTGKAGSAVGLALLHQMWVRRTRKGALLHARWQAFRRYLSDFSRMEESPPASLALWEQFLVYGIALGVAEQVLEAARLHAPPEVAQGGTFYSPGIIGSISGPYVFSFSNLENDFSEAFTPLSSSGSGGGGWFSGGGGGGFGGGGGGAW